MNDIKNLNSIILSGDTDYWRDQYSYNWPKCRINIVTPEEAIAIKYFRNAFLATKVSFFNEIFDFCQSYNLDFEEVQAGITDDERIGSSHSYVFPEEGVRGWVECVSKRHKSFIKNGSRKNINLNTLSAAVYYNTKLKQTLDK